MPRANQAWPIKKRCAAPARLENVVLQQMLYCGEWSSDQRSGPEHKQARDLRSPALPSPQPGPPILNGGLELPRSSHC